jgi:hypothetical protein
MRVGIAADHGGFGLKEEMVVQLRAAGHEIVDFGAHDLSPDDDYPDVVIMKQQIRLSAFTLSYAQVAVIFPVIVVSPRYFARQILLGGLMQAVHAFSYVQNALSFISLTLNQPK